MKRLVVCVLLVGCGGDDGGSNGSVAVDNLGMELALASCGLQFECCTDAEIMEQYMGLTYEGQPITTEAQCIELTNAFFTGFAVTQYKESIAKGRMEYDGAAAADCIAVIGGLSCTDYSTGILEDAAPGCRPFLIPKVADEGACTQSYECISDNCEGASNPLGEPSTDGLCKPMPSAGQPCDENCADGLYCDYDQTANMDLCKPLESDGTQCTFDDECASDHCDDETDTCAQEPLVCDGR